MAWTIASVSDWELGPAAQAGRIRLGSDETIAEHGDVLERIAHVHAADPSVIAVGGWFPEIDPDTPTTITGSMTLQVLTRDNTAIAAFDQYTPIAARNPGATHITDHHLGPVIREVFRPGGDRPEGDAGEAKPKQAAYIERWTVFPTDQPEVVLLTVQTPYPAASDALAAAAELFARSLAWAPDPGTV